METHEGKAWNTLFMHLVSVSNTMYVHLGDGGWTLDEVREYIIRRLDRGDIRYKNDHDRKLTLLEWSITKPEGFAYTAFNHDRLNAPAIFGVYEYNEGDSPVEAGMGIAERARNWIVEVNEWTNVPSLALSDADDFIKVSQGVLDMRLDLLSASTGVPRTALPIGTTKGLLDWDDAVGETFEYLLHLQRLPGISEADYREASHLLHRVSLHRWSLMDRIKREGIHVESDPDRQTIRSHHLNGES